jgi:hypothetical protein
VAGRFAPGGRLLVFNDSTVYGYGRRPDLYKWTTPLEYHFFAASKEPKGVTEKPEPKPESQRTETQKAKIAAVKKAGPKVQAQQQAQAAANRHQIVYDWSEHVPLYVRAMLLSGGTIFAAGPTDIVDEEDAYAHSDDPKVLAQLQKQNEIWQGRQGASLWAVSAKNGKKLAEYRLDSLPAYDGLAAANKCLYLVTTDGKVLCYGGH